MSGSVHLCIRHMVIGHHLSLWLVTFDKSCSVIGWFWLVEPWSKFRDTGHCLTCENMKYIWFMMMLCKAVRICFKINSVMENEHTHLFTLCQLEAKFGSLIWAIGTTISAINQSILIHQLLSVWFIPLHLQLKIKRITWSNEPERARFQVK